MYHPTNVVIIIRRSDEETWGLIAGSQPGIYNRIITTSPRIDQAMHDTDHGRASSWRLHAVGQVALCVLRSSRLVTVNPCAFALLDHVLAIVGESFFETSGDEVLEVTASEP